MARPIATTMPMAAPATQQVSSSRTPRQSLSASSTGNSTPSPMIPTTTASTSRDTQVAPIPPPKKDPNSTTSNNPPLRRPRDQTNLRPPLPAQTSSAGGSLGLTGLGSVERNGSANSAMRSASASPSITHQSSQPLNHHHHHHHHQQQQQQQQQHSRSLSVRSQASEVNTDGGSSSGRESLWLSSGSRARRNGSVRMAGGADGGESIASLGRSGSSASTVPTSPDVEPVPKAPQSHAKTSAPSNAWALDGGENFHHQKLAALRDLEESQLASHFDGEDFHSVDASSDKVLPTIDSVGDITHMSASSSTSSNLNKPLPPLVFQPAHTTDGVLPTSPVSSKASSKGTLRTAFAQSGKYFRTSSSFWSNQSSSSGRQSTGLSAPSLQASPNPSNAGSSTAPSPRMSQSDLSSSYHAPQPPRSHSPFLFRKRSKSNLLEPNAIPLEADSQGKSAGPSSYFFLRRGSRQSEASASPTAHSPAAGQGEQADVPAFESALLTDSFNGNTLKSARSAGSPCLPQSQSPVPISPRSRSPAPYNPAGPVPTPSSTRVGPEKKAFHRPSLRRDRSRSVDAMEPLTQSNSGKSKHIPLTGGHRHSASTVTSPKSGESTLGPSPASNPFQLPPIATSPDGLFLVDEEGDGGKTTKSVKSPSFKWTRVLSKRGSTSGRQKSQDAPVASSASLLPAEAPPSSISARSTSTVTSLRSRESTDGRRSSNGPSPSHKASRQTIVEGSKAAQSELSPHAVKPVQSRRRNSSLQSNASQRPPLSPQLANLWTKAVGLDTEDDLEAESKYHDARSAPISPESHMTNLGSEDTDAYYTPASQSASHSRKGSLSKTLATMFDLTPSLREHGALPQQPPMPQVIPNMAPTSVQGLTPQGVVTTISAEPQKPAHARSPSRSSTFNILSRSSGKKENAATASRQPSTAQHARAPSTSSTVSASNTAMITAPSSMNSIYHTPEESIKGPMSMSSSVSSRSLPGAGKEARKAGPASIQPTGEASSSQVRRVTAPGANGNAVPAAGIRAAELASQRARGVGGAVRAGPAASKGRDLTGIVKSSSNPSDLASRTSKLSDASKTSESTTRPRKKSLVSAKSLENISLNSIKSIPPRGSSQSSRQRREHQKLVGDEITKRNGPGSASSIPTAGGHRRTKSKPTLLVDTQRESGAPRRRALTRPSSAMGIYGLGSTDSTKSGNNGAWSNDDSMIARIDGSSTNGFARKLNQPQLQEMDDKAFLSMLEETRRVHQQKAAKMQEHDDRIARMAQMGMAPNRKAHQARGRRSAVGLREDVFHSHEGAGVNGLSTDLLVPIGSNRPSAETGDRTSRAPSASSGSHSQAGQRRRPTSADGRLGGRSSSLVRKDIGAVPSEDEAEDESMDLVYRPESAVESGVSGTFNVAKASAQLSSAYANDDDWKREVRALFIIRELLNTEQSYARHLESLLQAVRKKAINAPSGTAAYPRRKSVTTFASVSTGDGPNGKFSSSTTGSGAHGDRHLPLMRNLLPQLVALSRSLSARIDGNPTAAGVGTAFSVIAPQLEATFVAWSAAASEIMSSLRYTQGPKGKTKDKLILAPLSQEEGLSGGWSERPPRSSTSNILGLPTSASALTGMALSPSQSQPSSPRKTRRGSEQCDALTMPSSPALPATKRRSTISHGSDPGQLVLRTSPTLPKDVSSSKKTSGSGGARTASGPNASSGAPTSNSRPTSPWGFATATKRSIAAAASRPHTLTKKLASSTSSLDVNNKQFSDGTSPGAAAKSSGTLRPSSTTTFSTSSPAPHKALSVLDIAIMPMQRPPRYLLLLTELVRNTPEDSVSHARVVRSLDLIKGIAAKCDAAASGSPRAQA